MIGDTLRDDQQQARVVGRGVLLRYRALAFITATLLIVLVFVGVPLQFAASQPAVMNDVGTLHGFLYIGYLVVAFQLTRKLGIPKWQMLLVLLAGTIPFVGFVAERKMTKRFEALSRDPSTCIARDGRSPLSQYAGRLGKRWFSPRALLLHLEVTLVASACGFAGWWQTSRALAGNGLSWVYAVEWPVFGLLALGGWWYLIHEDPEVYKARKLRPTAEQFTQEQTSAGLNGTPAISVSSANAKLALMLVVLVGLELTLGFVAFIFVPLGASSGLHPGHWAFVFIAHVLLGLPLAAGAAIMLFRVRNSSRFSRMSGSIGAIGVAIAGIGGLLSEFQPLKFAGLALMLVGTLVAGLGYVIPSLEKL